MRSAVMRVSVNANKWKIPITPATTGGKGPREGLLGLIEFYANIVFEADEVTVNGLRTKS